MATTPRIRLPDPAIAFPDAQPEPSDPKYDRHFLPDSKGRKTGFIDAENGQEFHSKDGSLPLIQGSSKTVRTQSVVVDKSGKESVALMYERTTVYLDVRADIRIEHEFEPGKEKLELKSGSTVYKLSYDASGKAKYEISEINKPVREISEKDFHKALSDTNNKALNNYFTAVKTALDIAKAGQGQAASATVSAAASAPAAPTQKTGQQAAAHGVVNGLLQGSTLQITTDGTCAVVQDSMEDKADKYCGTQPPTKAKPNEKFQVDAMYGGAPTPTSPVGDNFLKDKKVQNALPEAVRKQIAAALNAGHITVLIDHKDAPAQTVSNNNKGARKL